MQHQLTHLTERIALLENENRALKTRIKCVEYSFIVTNPPELEPGAARKNELENNVGKKRKVGINLELDDSESRCE